MGGLYGDSSSGVKLYGSMPLRFQPAIFNLIRTWLNDSALLDLAQRDLDDNKDFDTSLIHAPLSHPEQLEKAKRFQAGAPDRKIHIALTCSTLPLNNQVFPRGIWIGGVRFPIVSDKFSKEVVGAAPSHVLRYPPFRHLALPSGVDRRATMIKLRELLTFVNAQKFEFYWQQVSMLTLKMSQDMAVLPVVMIPVELVAQSMAQSQALELEYWRLDSRFHATEKTRGVCQGLPTFDASIELLFSKS